VQAKLYMQRRYYQPYSGVDTAMSSELRKDHIDWLFETTLGILTSLVKQEDIEAYKRKAPGLNWELGFEEAIREHASNNRTWKEGTIRDMIDFIKEWKLEE
jgi:hypothetical protein